MPFPYPVVVKVLSSDITHKSDVGGVILGVKNRDELERAVARLPAGRVLVQQQLEGLAEVLIGYRVDAQAGPIVMLAAGGLLAELGRERSLRLAPVDLEAAREMIGEVKALRALSGYRGRQAADIEALARTIVALSQLARDPSVAEVEINPLLVCREGAIAVDALARR